MNDEFMTTEQVAGLLKVKKNTLEKARYLGSAGYPPFFRVGRLIRYRSSDVEAWMRKNSYNNDASPFFS